MSRTIQSGVVQRLLGVVMLLFAAHSTQTNIAQADTAANDRFVGSISYSFVGHLGVTDDAGRSLVWEATIAGDISGTMKWWFVNPPPVTPIEHAGGKTSFYAARWEVWKDEVLLLAGESAGKTVFPDGADGVWDGHGRVTQAGGELSGLIGRSVYETGPVILGDDPPRTMSGTGLFLVY